MTRLGYSFADYQILIAYILTLLGVTLPVAGAAGLIYRMSRLFELRRFWRAACGFVIVAASGLLSYAVVLNAHAPAAALVLASAACLIHVAGMNRDDRRAGWYALSGASAALAATLDPPAVVLLVLFVFVITSMRIPFRRQMTGVALYILGAVPVIAMHAAWNMPVTGDIFPASVHVMLQSRAAAEPVVVAARDESDDESSPLSTIDAIEASALWFFQAAFGEHGLFSHFPAMILGILGIGAVMHRHWPSSTKMLAAATLAGALATVVWYRFSRVDWSAAMFACQWFVVFSPMLLFWSGAWLRQVRQPAGWGMAAVLVVFSVVVGLIGATDPMPRFGYSSYTAVEAATRLIKSDAAPAGASLAGRAP
jgi:energy-converting hydrogenase Eha subunit C